MRQVTSYENDTTTMRIRPNITNEGELAYITITIGKSSLINVNVTNITELQSLLEEVIKDYKLKAT